MEKKYPLVPAYLKVFYLCIFLSIAVWLITLCSSQGYFASNPLTGHENVLFCDGWVDDAGDVIEIPGQFEVTPGEDFRIHYTFTEDVTIEKALLFRTDHTFVRAYINGREIYRFGDSDEIPFGKSPGSGWQLIEIGEVKAGDVLTIEQNCPYEKYSGLIREIKIGTKAELLSEIMISGLWMLLMTAIPFLIGIFIMLFPPFFFREYSPGVFFNIGIPFVMISIWSFTEARTWQLFFKNSYAMQILNFITFSLFVPCVLLSVYTMGYVKNKKMFKTMLMIDVGAAIGLLGLQVFEIADYFETLLVVHILIVVNAFIFITLFLRDVRKNKGMTLWMGGIVYLTIGFGAFMDLMDFYVWDKFGNGFFTRLIILALLVCCGLTTLRRALVLHRKNIEQKAYAKMAYTDNLTGLKNRRRFDEDMEALEKEPKEVTILYADMNGLKHINDYQGHHQGDSALKLIADELKQFSNALTTTCYRLGGDEFCILSFDQGVKELQEKCEQLNQRLVPYEKEYDYPIGISYGAKRFMPGTMTMHQCLVAAEKEMYDYKQTLYKERGISRER